MADGTEEEDVRPLAGLRLRTPRLELRLGSRDELRALALLARAGIHPPAEMPFQFGWTDAVAEPGFADDFVAFHEDALRAWKADSWTLNLLVFAGDELAGTQSLSAEAFRERRSVDTGSWLGQAFQGRGLGTEMRAAVLELAFRGLGAEEARSSWLEGNEASRRVSAKLGYRPAGTGTASPRGAPVVQHRVRLGREDWQAPVPVVLEGLAPCLHLFGAGG